MSDKYGNVPNFVGAPVDDDHPIKQAWRRLRESFDRGDIINTVPLENFRAELAQFKPAEPPMFKPIERPCSHIMAVTHPDGSWYCSGCGTWREGWRTKTRPQHLQGWDLAAKPEAPRSGMAGTLALFRDEKPPFEVTTQDPRFTAGEPVLINGHRYLPAARVELVRDTLKDAIT